ncbi:solute carrier organic anion transporter family member [Plakobranchus ocellatus]|uniref:Solute carrier organic anion transporter family member n=1 Tax=Plakobranchus ocellatus TaxID=259542 RepID=A0AAV4CBY6_9GAST|nr:solute carrier organic anion transporter family member [Plakobranchus ocellatus]
MTCKQIFNSFQYFSGVGTFVVLFGLASMYVGILTSYLGTQFIWLERLYDISPGGLKMMVTMGEIAFLILVLFLSGLARRWHMPRTLSITTFIIGIAALICVLPYAAHKPELTPPPNVTKETQYTMEKFKMMAPTCTVNEAMRNELTAILVAPTDENCEPLDPGAAPVVSQGSGPPGGSSSNDTAEDSGDATNSNSSLDDGAKNLTSPTNDIDPEPAQGEPPAPGPTVMMPDLTKIATHSIFETLASLAKAQYNVDLKALSKLSREEQQEAMMNMPPTMRQSMPALKAMLGENADSYFYPVTLPQSRRKRQADLSSGNQTDTTTEANEALIVEVDPKDQMLKKLQSDMNWNGQLAVMMSTSFAEMFANPCTQKKIQEFIASMCPYLTGPFLEDKESAATLLVALIVLGMMLAGIARAAHPAFSAIYVDSRSSERRTGVYLGILFGLGALGAVVAQLLGFYATTTYITMEDVGLMTVINPRWLGAWWVGFLIVGVACLILAPILFFFPNPRDKLISKQIRVKGVTKVAKNFFRSGMRLLGNPIFLLITLGNALTVMAADGMLRHLPKYVESAFSLPPMEDGLYLALAVSVIIVVGVFLGGLIATLAKLSPFSCLKLVTACAIVVFILQACALGLGCEQPKISKGEAMINLTSEETVQCSQTCVCMDFVYMPACGSDGVTYFTPCHAGCGHPIDKEWHHCKCIPDDKQTATFGLCEQECWGGVFYGFSFVIALACFLVALKSVPAFLAMFRSVEREDAPLAIGVNAFMVTLIGVIPSSNLYSSMFEGICLLERQACGPVDTCAIYDVEALRLRYNGLGSGLKALAALLYVVAMVLGFRENSVFSRKTHEAGRRK